MIKVSVILPVYGVSEYIEKCTESLLNQSIKEVEYIFVDDHGPDNSIELAKNKIKGSSKESQFKFIRPPHNLGAGMARNYALSFALGEYIAFVDSDDWIEPTMLEELYNKALEFNKCDICICEAFKDFSDGRNSIILKSPQVESGCFSAKNKKYFLVNYVSYFWTFLYKKEFLENNQIQYPQERSADDSYFVACSIMKANSLAYVNKPFYHYIIRPGSICTTKDATKYKKRLCVFNHLMNYAQKDDTYTLYKDEIDFIFIKKGYISTLFNYAINTTYSCDESIAEIYSNLLSHVPEPQNNKYVKKSVKVKLILWSIKNFPKFTIRIMRKLGKIYNMTV